MVEKLKWETKKVKVKDLIELDINPRKISDAKKQKLIESLEKFNLAEIPAVNTDMQIIGGNQRVSALMMVGRGEEEIDVRVPNRKLTKKEVKEYAIISNTHAGEFDFEILELEFADVQIEEIGFDVIGFDDWKKKQDIALASEAKEDDFDVPVGGIETDIVLGDLFEIGEHRLLCGDSTDSDSVAKLMNGEKADMVFTDPPYNVDYVGKTKEKLKIQNDKHNVSEFRKIISDSLSNLILFTKRGGAYYICIPLEVGVTDLFLERTHLQSVLIWLKNTIVMGRKDYQQQTEPILFLLNDTEEETYEGIVYGWNFGDSHEFYGGRKQSNVWKFDKPQRNGEHPTMKPIPLVGKAINNSSKEKDLILDLFIGSGTTMVASHQLKRKCYGMELDCKYVEVIVTRMIKLDKTLIIKRNGIEETQKWLNKIA